MSHIQYTICRSGTYYYNRRVPAHAVEAYGPFIRQALSRCPDEAAEYAKRLDYVLEASWSNTTRIQPVDIATIIESFKPKSVLLSEMAEEYLTLREIDQVPPRSAFQHLYLWQVTGMLELTHEKMPSCLFITYN